MFFSVKAFLKIMTCTQGKKQKREQRSDALIVCGTNRTTLIVTVHNILTRDKIIVG